MCLPFFFNDTATTDIYTLSLHDALPISPAAAVPGSAAEERIDAACEGSDEQSDASRARAGLAASRREEGEREELGAREDPGRRGSPRPGAVERRGVRRPARCLYQP